MGQKVNLVHGFNYQNYYLRKKYHFISLFIHKVAWVNKAKNFDILTFHAASVITNIDPKKFNCGPISR